MTRKKKNRRRKPAKSFTAEAEFAMVSNQRMARLSVELALAGTTVLKEKHGWDDRQVAEFLDDWLNEAQRVRREGEPDAASELRHLMNDQASE